MFLLSELKFISLALKNLLSINTKGFIKGQNFKYSVINYVFSNGK